MRGIIQIQTLCEASYVFMCNIKRFSWPGCHRLLPSPLLVDLKQTWTCVAAHKWRSRLQNMVYCKIQKGYFYVRESINENYVNRFGKDLEHKKNTLTKRKNNNKKTLMFSKLSTISVSNFSKKRWIQKTTSSGRHFNMKCLVLGSGSGKSVYPRKAWWPQKIISTPLICAKQKTDSNRQESRGVQVLI